MELKATENAQFFVQKEYSHVLIEDDYLIISSCNTEERIPFAVWSGDVTLQRGLLWGTLIFHAHSVEGTSTAWLVQGLPWGECKAFANYAVRTYKEWHSEQCRHLREHIPKWKESLSLLKKQPAYLPDSEVYVWRENVFTQLREMRISIDEATQRMPNSMKDIVSWLTDVERLVDDRNERWLETERVNWEVLFSQIESSPLNASQQHAVLLNNDNNLVLAGAGTGKTSVLTARIAYLLQSHLAQPNQLLMLAFGKDAVKEMEVRLRDKIGSGASDVTVDTFHQLGLSIITKVEQRSVELSPFSTDPKRKLKWCSDWLKSHWQTDTNLKRWRKHLSVWPIAYLKGDEELSGQSENLKLINWLGNQLDQLCSTHLSKKQLQQKLIDQGEYPRLNSELSLVWPCYLAWQQMLKENDQIDFYTMITRATEYVVKGKFLSPWRYIMVDEYQDISPDRIALIDALCTNKKGEMQSTLFAVGDDWQSIYQFAGSDVDLTTGFAERFSSSSVHYLDTTYRFNSMIAEVANRFIQKNPNQLDKELNSHFVQKQKSVTICSNRRIEAILDQLHRKVTQEKTVLLLGRNHYHKPELFNEWKKSFYNLKLEFMTCHGSKGKEADYVFVLSVDEGQFPAIQRQRHLNLVLCEGSDDYPDAEERRLFYVAMTRAKEKLWITHGPQASSFVNELVSDNYPVIKKS